MSVHYNYFSHLTSDANQQKLLLAVLLGAGLVVVGRKMSAKLTSTQGIDDLLVPEERLTGFGLIDVLVEKFVAFHDSILGRENRAHVPFTFSIFIFVFASNLIGLIPGMPAVTTTVWVNVGIALVVFLYFNAQGVRENGVVGYLKHFMGPIWWMAPVVFVLEIVSTCLRVLTLNLRLYWNITADHKVLDVFTELTGLFIPCLFYAMGTFVAFMQAFVFTILTMIYILLVTQHEEEGH